MADEPTDTADEQPEEQTAEAADTPAAEAPAEPTAVESTEEAVAEEPIAEEIVAEEPAVDEPVAEEPVVEEPVAEEIVAEEPVAEEIVVEEVVAVEPAAAEEAVSDDAEDAEEDEEPAPRVKPTVPGAHLEVDIVPEGVDPLAPDQPADPYAIDDEDEPQTDVEQDGGRLSEPISTAAIDLAAGARYNATGKRKTAIARVILRPGTGAYLVNGRALDEHFPRITLQRNIRQPLETVGYQDRMDVVARLQGGGISAQAGALRHGISRALLEADPNLRGELKRRGFLTRDSRAKERKKAGLKKARKRPQFSKR
jgi:small subunit ribosomal protein S9